jgi:hypothetical protein
MNCDVFEEVAKKELDELVQIFGATVGPLLHEHAHLE